MVDYTDDWMNPRSSFKLEYKKPENKMIFVIERKKRTICFGNPGSITRWEEYMRYNTKEERDKAYDDLRKNHPAWHLRKDQYNPAMRELRTYAR